MIWGEDDDQLLNSGYPIRQTNPDIGLLSPEKPCHSLGSQVGIGLAEGRPYSDTSALHESLKSLGRNPHLVRHSYRTPIFSSWKLKLSTAFHCNLTLRWYIDLSCPIRQRSTSISYYSWNPSQSQWYVKKLVSTNNFPGIEATIGGFDWNKQTFSSPQNPRLINTILYGAFQVFSFPLQVCTQETPMRIRGVTEAKVPMRTRWSWPLANLGAISSCLGNLWLHSR